MPNKSTEETGLVVRESKPQQLTRPGTFSPTTFAEALTFSEYLAKSDLAPKDFKDKPANVLIALQMGAELGLPPMAALQNIAVINGRPSLWGDAALAVVMSNPNYEGIREWFEGAGSTLTAYCAVKRRGEKAEHISSFSVDDAVRAKLWGKTGQNGQPTPWVTYPQRMLKMRARGFALRDKFADALRGLQIAEEAQDMPPLQGESDAVPRETQAKKRETQAKKREKEVATLEPSKEVNRGHGDEGLKQQEEAKPGGQPPTPAGETVVSDTQESAEATPPESADKALAVITGVVKKIDPKMSNVTDAQKAQAKKEKKAEPSPRPYFIITVACTEAGQTLDVPVYVWDTKMHEYVVKAFNQKVEWEIGRRIKNEGQDNEIVFYSLEEIKKIGDVTFVENQPVASPSAEQLGFSQ